MSKCFKEVKTDERFNKFKQVMLKTKGCTLKEYKVDELIQRSFNEMEVSFEDTVNNTITTLQNKIADIKSIHNPVAAPTTSKF